CPQPVAAFVLSCHADSHASLIFTFSILHPCLFFLAVDGDPHFVVRLPHSLGNLCFTLDGCSGDVLRLVSDPATGLSVNGHLMGAPFRPGHEERPRTYFDAITIAVEHPRVGYVVNVTRKGVTLHGEGELVLPFAQRAAIHKPQLAISVWPEANVTVWIGHEVEFLVLLHRYSHPTALQRDHLGFYVVNSKGLSASAGGLLGEQHLLQMQLLGWVIAPFLCAMVPLWASPIHNLPQLLQVIKKREKEGFKDAFTVAYNLIQSN
uniref:Inter-alpha-trypsin inhibitor heavy chain family member 6 n=1 Tax=Podarcis muralis TaxID=64176 RepID=A0A670KC65_PODMU